MEAPMNKSTNIRRGKRRTEPKNLKADKQKTKPAIWRSREDPKRKPESIRSRARKYGDEAEDSDYGDSPFRNKRSEDSESDSDEYDDDFDLSAPLQVETGKAQHQNSRVPQKIHTSTGSITPTRKESFTNATHSRRLIYHTHESDGSSTSLSNHSLQQSRSNFLNPTQKYPLQTRKEEKMPALTPEEAIKLVMERNSYISDSERTEDAHPVLFRKASVSTSTCETANNTVGSDSGHNRTPEGKRVLVLKKKKPREDTHPRTSKNRHYHQRNSQEPHRRSSRQEQSITNKPISHRKYHEENRQVLALQTYSGLVQSTRQAKSSISRPLESSTPIRRSSGVEENTKLSRFEQKDRNEEKMIIYPDKVFGKRNDSKGTFGNDQVENAGHNNKILTSVEKQPQASKLYRAETRLPEKTFNKRPQRESINSISEELTEVHAIVISESDYCSDSETGKPEDDCWGGHEDDTQRPSNRSTMVNTNNVATLGENELLLKALEDKDDDIDSLAGEEEDWRNMSWKTAKTSRSVLSKYSKSSSVALWMKNMEEAESGDVDQDDDIFFFDAIQEAGHTSSSKSDSTTEKDSTDDAMGTGEDDGWKGKITNFVGYTIGALTSSNDNEDQSTGDSNGVVASPPVTHREPVPARTLVPPSSGSTKKVPSRELEIIRKCQQLMTSQRVLVEAREKEAAKNGVESMRLQRQEEAARARVFREVMAYREMMEGMGKGAKLAPLDRKAAAQDYDDRLSMVKTLEDQEKKMRMHERSMMEMEMGGTKSREKSCCCSCTIS